MEKKMARIVGIGSYLPERILTNAELEGMVETSDEWIMTRTGIRERRIAAPDQAASDLGLAAAEKALANAGVAAEEIELIIVATCSADYIFPSTASIIQAKLGAKNAGAVDIQAACSGHIYGLSIAKAYVESGMYKKVLLVSAEKISCVVNYQDRGTCILFGDGSSAAVISDRGAGFAIGVTKLGAEGDLADILMIPAGGSRKPITHEVLDKVENSIVMNGKEVFRHAVRRMGQVSGEVLEEAGLTPSDLSWLVPHQANTRIIEAIGKRFDLPDERIYRKPVEKYGNNSAPSVGIAMDELLQEHEVAIGERLLLVAFGAGLTWGATLLTKVSE